MALTGLGPLVFLRGANPRAGLNPGRCRSLVSPRHIRDGYLSENHTRSPTLGGEQSPPLEGGWGVGMPQQKTSTGTNY